MRKRDPKHEAQLATIQCLSPPELKRRISIGDHDDSGYVASEVLATLIRNRFGQANGVLTAAVEEVNRRIHVLVGKRMRGMTGQPQLARRGDQVLTDTIDYVWLRFFEETVAVSNSEVRFAVFVRDRFDDFMRHLRADKNSMESVDAMCVSGKEGNTMPFIDTVEDLNAENPEQAAASNQQNAKVKAGLLALPQVERNAFIFRAEFKYEWQKVAELLECSIPTANKHFAAAMAKLEGALE